MAQSKASAELLQDLATMAEGYEMSAEAEQLIVVGLDDARQKFRNDDRDPTTMRRLRVLLDAEKNVRRFTKDAANIRAAIAHLNTKKGLRE